MDIESHLQRIEADVRCTRMLVWVLVVIVVAVGLRLLQVIDSTECIALVVVVLGLTAVAHLLVSAMSGLRRFWPSREADAQLQERILREFIAERAKTQGQAPNP